MRGHVGSLLRRRGLADETVFQGEVFPGQLVRRHDLDRALESVSRVAMFSLLRISQAEVFPDRRVIGI
jgi:hypothetical protein